MGDKIILFILYSDALQTFSLSHFLCFFFFFRKFLRKLLVITEKEDSEIMKKNFQTKFLSINVSKRFRFMVGSLCALFDQSMNIS